MAATETDADAFSPARTNMGNVEMPFKRRVIISSLGGLSLTPFIAGQSAAQGQGRPPEPPFAAIGSDLGLSDQQVENCFPKPQKSGSGGKPARPDMSQVSECLQKADSSLSASQIESVLKKNRPKR